MAITIDFLGIRGKRRKNRLLQMTDAELIRDFRKREDLEIISLLMDRYQDVIVARTVNYLKDEVATQDFIGDLYLKLADKLKQDLLIREFKPWLRRMITNTLIDGSRRHKRYEQYVGTLQEDIETIDGKIALEIDGGKLAVALESLRPLPRLYVIQHFFMGKQNQEIAKEQGLEMNQVRGARSRALKSLKEALGGDFKEYFQE